MDIIVFPDAGAMCRDAAYRFVALSAAKTRKGEIFSIALAGGRTPETLYRLLASEEFAPSVDWSRVHLFFGDERCVPTDSEFCNWRMANESLFAPLGLAESNIHRMQADLQDHEEAAALYESDLESFFGKGALPRFDLVLLGMGSDGHCASLFPQKSALHEVKKSVVVSEPGLKPFVPRVTLTFPVINNAANVLFMVGGADKAETLVRVIQGERSTDILPSQSVAPTNGSLIWLTDKAASANLK